MTVPEASRTLDAREVERFGAMASAWWDPDGTFKPLHDLMPARLAFIRRELCRGRNVGPHELRPLTGLRVLDIGCGGGLVCEPLARLGADVTGIDPAPDNIQAAAAHAAQNRLTINYRAMRAEDLVATGETFDAVTCLEVVEHVPDVPAFLATCTQLVTPGGRFILSTINRTLASYALAIVAAEYVLGWLPRGTHRWDRFVCPDELSDALARAGMGKIAFEGLVFRPLENAWRLSRDTRVNYLAVAQKAN